MIKNAKSIAARLLSRVMIDDLTGCHIWQGQLNSAGYGRMHAYGAKQLTHRLSYEVHRGRIPAGQNVCHRCDNRRCINPEHLWAGTQSENIKDAVTKGRVIIPSQRRKRHD
jgi:hypothetical protein